MLPSQLVKAPPKWPKKDKYMWVKGEHVLVSYCAPNTMTSRAQAEIYPLT